MSGTESPISVLLGPPTDPTEVGVRALLATDPRFVLVGEPAMALVSQVRAFHPMLSMFDPAADDHLDLGLIRSLRAAAPESHSCVYTNHFEPTSLVDAFQAGVRGYLLKRERRSQNSLLDFLSSVGHGNLGIDAAIIAQLLRPETARLLVTMLPADLHLDGRELAVLRGLMVGRAEPEIAEALELSLRTVRRTVDALRAKFHARNVRELLLKVAQLGLNR